MLNTIGVNGSVGWSSFACTSRLLGHEPRTVSGARVSTGGAGLPARSATGLLVDRMTLVEPPLRSNSPVAACGEPKRLSGLGSHAAAAAGLMRGQRAVVVVLAEPERPRGR
jgi:hypothetical protein